MELEPQNGEETIQTATHRPTRLRSIPITEPRCFGSSGVSDWRLVAEPHERSGEGVVVGQADAAGAGLDGNQPGRSTATVLDEGRRARVWRGDSGEDGYAGGAIQLCFLDDRMATVARGNIDRRGGGEHALFELEFGVHSGSQRDAARGDAEVRLTRLHVGARAWADQYAGTGLNARILENDGGIDTAGDGDGAGSFQYVRVGRDIADQLHFPVRVLVDTDVPGSGLQARILGDDLSAGVGGDMNGCRRPECLLKYDFILVGAVKW